MNPKEARDLETKIKLAKYELQNYLVTFRDLCSSRLFQILNITSIFTTIHKVFYQNNFFHSLCFGDLIYEAKGVLVMLKIISENLVFFEDGKPFEGKFGSDGLFPATETIEATVQNILYLILNVSCSFKDVISKALNDNSSQHAFKKIKRVYG